MVPLRRASLALLAILGGSPQLRVVIIHASLAVAVLRTLRRHPRRQHVIDRLGRWSRHGTHPNQSRVRVERAASTVVGETEPASRRPRDRLRSRSSSRRTDRRPCVCGRLSSAINAPWSHRMRRRARGVCRRRKSRSTRQAATRRRCWKPRSSVRGSCRNSLRGSR